MGDIRDVEEGESGADEVIGIVSKIGNNLIETSWHGPTKTYWSGIRKYDDGLSLFYANEPMNNLEEALWIHKLRTRAVKHNLRFKKYNPEIVLFDGLSVLI